MTTASNLTPRAERVLESVESSIAQASNMSFDNDNVNKLYNDHCTYLPAMLGWFLFSALITSYNKYVFGEGHMAFPCPLFLTSLHFGVQWSFSHYACEIFPETLGTQMIKDLDWKTWAAIAVPCGVVTAMDVGLSNLSLAVITITFYTMVKSSTPVFVLGWAHIFGIERITLQLIGVAAVIAVGEFVTVYGEINFVLKGFLLCLTASVLSGARWTLVQLKLQSMEPPLKTTIATMRLLSPCMFFIMLLMSLVIEQPWNDFPKMNSSDLWWVLILGAGGGAIAVSMILCEFYLILEASAIVLMIGGVLKEMVTIVIGVTLFGDDLNGTKIFGMCIVFSGVILYKIVFHLEKEEKAAGGAYQPVNTENNAANGEDVEAEEMEVVGTGTIVRHRHEAGDEKLN
ncbi:unnamed protein product [Cylindrotheca closterium]|uniref:Sugar phosphate transporter domain-containing protein n=1 Tax=Cylindrotheca closterium TaxID=2856 RepID=A0AAD2JNQ0_9STRA|nr:unnamed protein product [Cylindrotheca closterium]